MVQLPEQIKNSRWLAAKHKQLLTSVASLPVVDPSFEDEKLKNIFQYYSLTPDEMDEELHRYASELLSKQKVDEAWQVLLSSTVV